MDKEKFVFERGEYLLPACGTFCADQHFLVRTDSRAIIPILHMSDTFLRHFINEGGLVEDAREAMSIRTARARENCSDADIFEVFGGQENLHVPISAVFAALRLHGTYVTNPGPFLIVLSQPTLVCTKDRFGETVVATVRFIERELAWSLDARPVLGEESGIWGGNRLLLPVHR